MEDQDRRLRTRAMPLMINGLHPCVLWRTAGVE